MVCLSKVIMSKHRASSPPTVGSGAPTDNKGDPLHIMCNSSKYFLILRLAQKRPITGGNKTLAVTSKKGGAVSVHPSDGDSELLDKSHAALIRNLLS